MKTITLTDKDLYEISVVLDYLLDSERKHYEEEYCEYVDDDDENGDVLFTKDFYNKPEIDHIYAYTRRIKDVIESQ
jgi:hypothetical protein